MKSAFTFTAHGAKLSLTNVAACLCMSKMRTCHNFVCVCVWKGNLPVLGDQESSEIRVEVAVSVFLKRKCQQTRLAEPSQAKIGNKSTTATTTTTTMANNVLDVCGH